MSFALYRKYRPKSFDALLGQDEVRTVLQNAARFDKLSHAYLFYGARGTGKTTAARLIAKIANCERRREDAAFRAVGEPCNACRPCTEIDGGHGLDVVEIDAASNRGIDEIRALKEGIQVSPSSYQYKVFIIDEVHMLTREAFNALLKTLEEPPQHVIMVLATTEYDKIPPTITSRTQRFHFRKLAVAEIIQKLNIIVAAENLTIVPDALELIAAMAEGSVRDAESMLGQIVSMEGHVDLQTVERIVGKVGYRAIVDFTALILKKDLPGALHALAQVYEGGHNIVDFNKDLITYLRRLLALKFDPTLEELLKKELTRDELARLKEQTVAADGTFLIALLKSLLRAYSEMRYSPLPIAPLEVAIIEHLKGFV